MGFISFKLRRQHACHAVHYFLKYLELYIGLERAGAYKSVYI